jgi:hypothetical protein
MGTWHARPSKGRTLVLEDEVPSPQARILAWLDAVELQLAAIREEAAKLAREDPDDDA